MRTRRRSGVGMQMMRSAMRQIRKNPGTSVAIIGILALGIAANSAVLSIVSGVLLKPLPYEAPEELALVRVDRPSAVNHPLLSGTEYHAFLEADGIADAAAVTMQFDMRSLGSDESVNVPIVGVTPNLFPMLGVRPILGRTFPVDEEPDPRSAVLTWDFWQNRFGGDSTLVGRSITFGESPYIVLGILPPDVRLLMGEDTGVTDDVAAFFPSRVSRDNPTFATFRIIARLDPNVSIDRASRGIAAVGRILAEQEPEALGDQRTYRLTPLHADLVSGVRAGILALLAQVGLVMLIACMNAAGLLLARGAADETQLAVRAALGASPRRLVAQVISASGLLTAIAAVVGIAGGAVLLQVGLGLYPESVPRLDDIGLDRRALLLSVLLAALVAVIFGLLPARQIGRTDPQTVLRASSSRITGPSRSRYVLVTAQVALSLALLVGAGLMLKTMNNLRRIPLGFEPNGLSTAKVVAPFGNDGFWPFYQELARTLQEVPGVSAVSAVSRTPLVEAGDVEITPFHAVGDESNGGVLDLRWVMPGYFEAIGTRIVDGRGITEEDLTGAGPVVVIDTEVANDLWPGESAVNREFMIPAEWGGEPVTARVVGVVEHARLVELKAIGRPQAYRAMSLTPFGVMTVLVRSSLEHGEVVGRIRTTAERLGARNVHSESAATEIVATRTSLARLIAALAAGLAGSAGIVSIIGIYGLLSFLVTQRRKETGIRMVLGARDVDIQRMHVGMGLRLVGLGLLFGIVFTLFSSKVIETQLFGVDPWDPTTLAGAALLYLTIGALASYIPARAASRVDPAMVIGAD